MTTDQAGTPAAGNVRAPTGTSLAGTPAGQGFATGLTRVGHLDAASGCRLTEALMVGDVPIGRGRGALRHRRGQGVIAAAVDERY